MTEKEKKEIQIRIRLTETQKEQIMANAKKMNLSMSEYLRGSAVNDLIKKLTKDELIGLRSDVRRIGNNLNQIAKKVNQHFFVDKSDELLNELQFISFSLQQILNRCE